MELLGFALTLLVGVCLTIALQKYFEPDKEETIEDYIFNNLTIGKTIPGPPPLDEDFYKKDKDVEVVSPNTNTV